MAEDRRHRIGYELAAKDEVGVAQADADDLDQDFAGAGAFDLQRFDREILPCPSRNGGTGLHVSLQLAQIAAASVASAFWRRT